MKRILRRTVESVTGLNTFVPIWHGDHVLYGRVDLYVQGDVRRYVDDALRELTWRHHALAARRTVGAAPGRRESL